MSRTPFSVRAAAGLISIYGATSLSAAVTPGGTFADKAIITEAGGGEQLTRATSGTGLGPVLVHDFDNPVVVDPTYEILTPTNIALSSGRHLVMYATRFDAHAGANRAEIISNITLAGAQIAAGTSQGFIRRTGGADETVISGGAIINVAADDDVLTVESRRSDNNSNVATLPTREPNYTSAQLLKLDDSWPYLNLERTSNQAGAVGTGGANVIYQADNSAGTHGSAFSFTTGSADITLNEGGLYLVFANTQLEKAAGNNTRTNYQQSLTLDGVAVDGATTTTYLRGNANGENAQTGVASVGRIISAAPGQILRVRLTMEGGGTASTIQGTGTAITAVKLPIAAKYIEVSDSSNQNVLNAAATPISFNTQVSASNATFSHSGGSTVTANSAGDYLFFGSLFTQSDATNDNHDRVIPITRWRQNGSTILDRGQGGAYNRDNGGNRTSGSWNSTLITLAANDTVEMTSENVGTASGAFPNTPTIQGLEIASLVVNNDPAIATNAPLSVTPSSAGNIITDSFLDTFDNDTAPAGLTYTVDTAPTGGTLRLSGAPLGMGGTFTQDDIDNNLVTFDADPAPVVGGFDFTVSDGGASESSSFVVNVEWPTSTVTVVDDGDVTEGGVSDFIFTSDVAPVGADLTVTIAYSGSASNGTDFTGATTIDILDGQTSAALNVTTLADGLFEGVESITATITDVSGLTITGAIGSPSSATFLVSDGANSAPTGSNLAQVISGIGNVPIADIVVADGDKGASSTVTGTGGEALFHTNGITNLTNYSDGRADDDSTHDLDATGPALNQTAGFSLELEFIPQAADLVGTVQLWEIGGSSNGSAVLLVDGVPHLLSKANGVAADQPTDDTTVPGSFNDLNWEPDDTIVVPLNGANVLTAGQPACLAVVFDINGNQVKSSVNGSAEVITALSVQSGLNFRGDHTVNFVNAGTGTGGNTNTPGNTFTDVDIKNLANGNSAVSHARFWNESGGSAAGLAGAAEVVTATLTIGGWSSAANGTLTASSGNGETFLAGVWTVTGTVDVVNAALAATEFVTGGSTADPTVINVSLEDGDEDGGGPTTGAIIYSASNPDPIYVDDSFVGNLGDPIADADLGAAGAQAATFGLNAFTSVTGALGAVTPTGTIIVNDGDYSTENVVLADTVILRLTDTAGPVEIGSLGAASTNSIELQSNTLEVGATAVVGPGIDAVISGTGGVTKVGAGLLVFRGVNTYTGTTAVNDGMFRIGQVASALQGELAGDGPVVVTAPGRFELNVDLNQTINQTGLISGTGEVATLGDGTVVFDNPGANTFSGGFELGDGASSLFDGVDQGARQGFVVVNHSGHLGTGKILSRGGQLQAGTPGVVIANDIDITGGGFRNGGSVDFEFAGTITTIDGGTRGFGNYGLEGCDLTISGNIVMTAGGNVNFEGSNARDNGTWTVTGDISGPQNVLVQNGFDDGIVTLSGNLSHTGTTVADTGLLVFNATQTGGNNVTVNANGTMTGNGTTTSNLVVNGVLAPGASPGTLTVGNLTINGTLEVEADNNTPDTGHDQVVANGSVTLGAASILVIEAGAGLTAGSLVIIDNDGGDAITGTFAGLAEGASFDADVFGFDATASYVGGDSNDFAINFANYTVLGQWRVDFYGNPANVGAGANNALAANSLPNLQSFAFGLDPNDGSPGVLDVSGGSILAVGPPMIWLDTATDRFYLRHTRRTDFAAIPLTITDQFSRDLGAFEDSAVPPTVIGTGTGTDGAAIEAVQTELPVILPVNGGKARFGRVNVTN